jgi:hypothetical protein
MPAAEIVTPAMWYKKEEYCATGELMNRTIWSKIAGLLIPHGSRSYLLSVWAYSVVSPELVVVELRK